MKLYPLLVLVLLQSVPSLSDEFGDPCVEAILSLQTCGEKNGCKAFVDDLLSEGVDDTVDDPTGTTDDGTPTCAAYNEEFSAVSCPKITDQCSACAEEASAAIECYGQLAYDVVAAFANGFGSLLENVTSAEEDVGIEECVVKIDCSAGSMSATGMASFVAVATALAFMMN